MQDAALEVDLVPGDGRGFTVAYLSDDMSVKKNRLMLTRRGTEVASNRIKHVVPHVMILVFQNQTSTISVRSVDLSSPAGPHFPPFHASHTLALMQLR
jgi:hypothetical protein